MEQLSDMLFSYYKTDAMLVLMAKVLMALFWLVVSLFSSSTLPYDCCEMQDGAMADKLESLSAEVHRNRKGTAIALHKHGRQCSP